MNDTDDLLTVAQFAALHGMAENNVLMILRADARLAESDRRIPGAVKVGSKFRGEWRIPRASAEAFVRDRRGRPKA